MDYKVIKQAEMDLEANSGQPDGELSPGIAGLGWLATTCAPR